MSRRTSLVRRLSARLPLLLGLAVVFAVGLAACGSSTEPNDSPVGVFDLILVNGEEVPYVLGVNQNGDSFEITRGSFTFNEDATCLLVIVETETVDGDSLETSTEEECTWETFREVLYVTSEDGFTQSINWVGNRIILPVSQLGLVFERS